MIGREAELERVLDIYKIAAKGESQVLIIRGEAGIGKSRLVYEFFHRLKGKSLTVLQAECSPLQYCLSPFAPIINALIKFSQKQHEEPTLTLGPGLTTLAGLVSPQGPSIIDRESHASQILEHVRGTLVKLGVQRTVVFVIEDIHWADIATRELVQFLARNLGHSPVMLILTARTDEPASDHFSHTFSADLIRIGAEVIDLEPLSRQETRRMLDSLLKKPADEDLIHETFRRSAGNPLYCEFLWDVWAAGGVLPSTLRDLLLERVARVSHQAREILELLAIVGRPVPDGMITRLFPESAVSRYLREAIDVKLVIFKDGCFQLRHALIGEALLLEKLPAELAPLHRRIAEVLTESPALAQDAAHSIAVRVANHWSAAGEHLLGLEAAINAASLIELSSPAEALRLYEHAFDLYDSTGRWPDGGDKSEVMRRAAETAFHVGDVLKACEFVREALATPAVGKGTPRALLHEHLGRYLEGCGGECQSVECYERALQELTEIDDERIRARVLCSCGLSQIRRGQEDLGNALLRTAQDIVARSGDVYLESIVNADISEAAYSAGDPDTALACAKVARVAAIRAQNWHQAIRTYAIEAKATYSKSGLLSDSIRVRREGLRFAQEHGRSYTEGVALRLSLVEDMIEAGLWDAAVQLLGDPPCGDPKSIVDTEKLLVWNYLALQRGEPISGTTDLENLLPAGNFIHECYFLSLLIPMAGALGINHLMGRLSDRALELSRQVLLSPGGGVCLIDALAAAIRFVEDITETRAERVVRSTVLLNAAQHVYDLYRRYMAAEIELTDGILEEARAEVRRYSGASDQEGWVRAAAIFRHTGALSRLIHPLFRQAEELSSAGPEHAKVRAVLCEAYDLAEELGADPVRRKMVSFAQDAGIEIDAEPSMTEVLTPRQQEVLGLVAEGLTDKEIATQLVVSPRTASAHVAQILSRLGLRNRSEAAIRFHRLSGARRPR